MLNSLIYIALIIIVIIVIVVLLKFLLGVLFVAPIGLENIGSVHSVELGNMPNLIRLI